MSRDYSRVAPQFWTGSTGRAIRALGAECQMLALYLLTSPHSTATGLYSLPLAYISADTGLTIEGASKALLSLREVGFCDYDENADVIWVPEMARFQIAEALKEKDKRGPWVIATASKFRKHRFFRRFVLKYREAFALRIGDDELPNDTDAQSPIEGPSKPLRCQEQEQDQEQDQEQEQRPAAAPTSRGVGAFFGSFTPKSPIRDTLVAMVTETRGTAVFRPVSWEDQEAVRKLAEWAEAQPDPLGSARASLAAFWAAKGTGARLSWLTDGDPGMYLGKVASRPDLAGLRAELEDANRRYRLVDDRIEETFGQEREVAEREAEEIRRVVIALRERLRRAEAA